MADIQVGRFGRLAQVLFDLKQAMTLGQAMPDVLPTYNIEAPRPEMEIFSGNFLFWGHHEVAAVAGQNGQILFTMPAAAGRLAVIERIELPNVTGAGLSWLLNVSTGTGVGAVVAGNSRDTRLNVVASTARVTLATSAVPSTTAFAKPVGATNGTVVFHGPIVVAPRGLSNANLLIQAQTANVELRATILWRERAMGPQEAAAQL